MHNILVNILEIKKWKTLLLHSLWRSLLRCLLFFHAVCHGVDHAKLRIRIIKVLDKRRITTLILSTKFSFTIKQKKIDWFPLGALKYFALGYKRFPRVQRGGFASENWNFNFLSPMAITQKKIICTSSRKLKHFSFRRQIIL